MAVYLIGGFLYQRLVVGAKGMDQFPNYTFWVEVGNLTAVSGASNTDASDGVSNCVKVAGVKAWLLTANR